jgi:hypothetical protein
MTTNITQVQNATVSFASQSDAANGCWKCEDRSPTLLLGHRDLEETTIYLHLSERHLSATASPLDSLELKDRPLQDE